MKRLYTTFSLLILMCFAASGQDTFEERYRTFQQQSSNQYRGFREECNKEYLKFLRSAWDRFYSKPPVPVPDFEEVPPVVLDTTVVVIDNELAAEPYEDIEIDPVRIPEYNPAPAPQPSPEDKCLEFEFYSTPVCVRSADDNRFNLKGCNGEAIAQAWDFLCKSRIAETLQDIQRYKTELCLCDWAWLQLLNSYAGHFLGAGNESVLMTAFLFCQSGYDMRLGFQNGRLVLLFPSQYVLYDKPYYTINGKSFFAFNGEGGDIEVANFDFPDARESSFRISSELKLNTKLSKSRTLESTSGVAVTSQVNTNLIDFYNAYPDSQYGDNQLSRWAIYARTPASEYVRNGLYKQLVPKIKDIGEYDAVSLLLDFVQNAFEYEYDEKVWGRDRAFFAEETLFYPYADCEDRTILFSHLVRDLVGLNVSLVYYPGHLAAAVQFTSDVKGDFVRINGNRFVICDPTYIGAPVGVTMTGMDNCKAKLLVL